MTGWRGLGPRLGITLCVAALGLGGLLALAAPAGADPGATTGPQGSPTSTDAPAPQSPPGPPAPHTKHKVEYPTVETANGRVHELQASSQASGSGPLGYGGGVDDIGVTTGAPKIYLVFWGSQWGTSSTGTDGYLHLTGDPQAMAPRLQALFNGLGTNGETWSGVMTQYCEGVNVGATSCPANSAHVAYPTTIPLAGVWVDTATAAPSQASDHQLGVEALNAVSHFGNTSPSSNRNAQYIVVSPTATHPGGFNTKSGQFCAWHDYNGDTTLNGGAISSPYGDFAFTNLPYLTDLGPSCGANFVNAGDGGTLDGVTIVEGHEYAETITDQNPAGGWTDTLGYENADKCAWIGGAGPEAARDVTLATGSFAMQTTYSNDTNSCLITHAIVTDTVSNDFSITPTPTTASTVQGASAPPVTVGTQVVSGSAQTVTFSVTGLPSGVTGAFNPNSVTAGASSQLTFTAASNAATGSFTVNLVGTTAATTHSTPFTLTVTPVNDFSIAMTPPSVSAVQGANAQSSALLTLTAGSAQTANLAVTGLPSGAAGSFGTNPINSNGDSSILTLSTSAATPPGAYTLTVTATGASASHSTTLALTVTSADGLGVVNGGFETGTLSGWTVAASAGVSSPSHSGAYAALVGSTSPTRGDSSIAQTFTASSTNTTLTFWYRVHCPDTVQHDWATVTLRDKTTGKTKTLLAKTCTNTGAWVQLNVGITHGHGYTITLVSHDDNHAGDPTYVSYDDVNLH